MKNNTYLILALLFFCAFSSQSQASFKRKHTAAHRLELDSTTLLSSINNSRDTPSENGISIFEWCGDKVEILPGLNERPENFTPRSDSGSVATQNTILFHKDPIQINSLFKKAQAARITSLLDSNTEVASIDPLDFDFNVEFATNLTHELFQHDEEDLFNDQAPSKGDSTTLLAINGRK